MQYKLCTRLLRKAHEPGHKKIYLMLYENNQGADQLEHPRSLTSAFVVRFSDSVVSIVAKSEISRLYLVSVDEKAGLSLTWSKTPEDTFFRDEAHMFCLLSMLGLR